MPRPMPETADSVAAMEMPMMSAICVSSEGSTPNSTFSPAAICFAPSPRDVAMPNTAPNTASRSTAWPTGP